MIYKIQEINIETMQTMSKELRDMYFEFSAIAIDGTFDTQTRRKKPLNRTHLLILENEGLLKKISRTK